jgi:hypothetical protein
LDAEVVEKADEGVDGLVVIDKHFDGTTSLPRLFSLKQGDIINEHLVAESGANGSHADAVKF